MADMNAMLGRLNAKREASTWFTPVDEDGAPFVDGDGQPFQIHLLSRRSEKWRERAHTWELHRAVIHANSGKITLEDAKRYEKHRVECLIAVTLEWRHLSVDGQPVACTPVTMTNLYNDPAFKEQMLAFMDDLTQWGLPAEAPEPKTEAEDAAKKFVSGASGDSLSATA